MALRELRHATEMVICFEFYSIARVVRVMKTEEI